MKTFDEMPDKALPTAKMRISMPLPVSAGWRSKSDMANVDGNQQVIFTIILASPTPISEQVIALIITVVDLFINDWFAVSWNDTSLIRVPHIQLN